MSELNGLSIFLTVAQSVIQAVVLVLIIRVIKKNSSFFLPKFVGLSVLSYLVSNVYWIAYDALRPDTRLPFAANEIAECAMILLLAAGLDSYLKDRRKVPSEIIFSFMIIIIDIFLWIKWSGEWIQDIIFGIPYIYFVWTIVKGLFSTKAFKNFMYPVIAVLLTILKILQVTAVYTDEVTTFRLDVGSWIIMFGVMIWLMIECFRKRNIFVAAAFFQWSTMTMYSCAELDYCFAVCFNSVSIITLYLAVRKEVRSLDIR